jgi:hypothetical protein
MAAGTLVLCSPLCFLIKRIGSSAISVLKTAVIDFYDVGDLAAAKVRLLEDVKCNVSAGEVPRVPDRRDGEMRAIRIVDDIFTVLLYLDEHLLLKQLPIYVSDSPDAMPSTRLYEGDLGVLINSLKRMQDQIDGLGVKLAAIAAEAKSTYRPASVSMQSPVIHKTSARSAISASLPVVYQHPEVDCRSVGQSEPSTSAGIRSEVTSHVNTVTAAEACHRDWAMIAASSPIVRRNQFASLDSMDDDNNDDGEPFNVYESRRSAKRRRQSTATQHQQQQPPQQRQQQQDRRQPAENTQERRKRGLQLIKGRSSANIGGIAAAKVFIDKAVFCIDNVSTSVTCEDLKRFVGRLEVNVLSCFRTQPRLRRGETRPISGRCAFRLCIAASDRDRLLDGNAWPDSVVISEWYRARPTDVRAAAAATAADNAEVAVQPTAMAARTSLGNVSTAAAATSSSSTAVAAAGGGDSANAARELFEQSTGVATNAVDPNETAMDETTILYQNGAAVSAQ